MARKVCLGRPDAGLCTARVSCVSCSPGREPYVVPCARTALSYVFLLQPMGMGFGLELSCPCLWCARAHQGCDSCSAEAGFCQCECRTCHGMIWFGVRAG